MTFRAKVRTQVADILALFTVISYEPCTCPPLAIEDDREETEGVCQEGLVPRGT